MDDFEIIQIINDLALEVRNFKKHRSRNQWQFSCEVCGDSRVNRHKARFGIAKTDGAWVCHCFNCGYSNSLPSYLKHFHPNLYERYVVDTFEKQKPQMFEIDHLIEHSVSNKVLTNIFFINRFENRRDWLGYLERKKVLIKRKNIEKLLLLHRDYWNERSLVQE